MNWHNLPPTEALGASPPLDSGWQAWMWDLARTLFWALVGGTGGLLVGFLTSSYACRDGHIYNCYPTQELKIRLLTVVGVFTGVLISRLLRSVPVIVKVLMTTLIAVVLVALVIASHNRLNPWSCGPMADCQYGDAMAST